MRVNPRFHDRSKPFGALAHRPSISRPRAAPTVGPATALDRLAHVLAVWFGCGHLPAPGTAGTLGAIPLYLVVRPHGRGAVAGCALLLTVIAVWAADRVARRLAAKDPQIICIDEVAGVFVTWSVAPQTTAALIAGVVLFRIFDQWKPWPARLAERQLPGGYGIVLDDVAAGAWGAVLLALLHRAGLL